MHYINVIKGILKPGTLTLKHLNNKLSLSLKKTIIQIDMGKITRHRGFPIQTSLCSE